MALQTKVYTQTSNTFTLELTLTENSTSVSGNSSSVSYTLKLKSTTKDFYQYGVGASVSLDGKTVATRDRYTAAQIGIGTYSSVTLLSGTATVGHGADGTKTMALSYGLRQLHPRPRQWLRDHGPDPHSPGGHHHQRPQLYR